MNKWLDNTIREQMDSDAARDLIAVSVGTSFAKTKPSSVLCIGCGQGTEMALFATVGVLPKGIDGNKESVSLAKDRGFDVTLGDMHDLPYKDESFDLVFSRDVFEHSYAPILLMGEMARVAKNYVAITLPDETWGASDVHYIIPTMKQMQLLGQKNDLSLTWFEEFNLLVGIRTIGQSMYIFRKNK